MPGITEPLREEHKELLPHLESLRDAGNALSQPDEQQLEDLIDRAYAFLSDHLLPHATAEEAALYPVVAQVMGAEMATKTMSRDHVAIGKLVVELGSLRETLSAGTADDSTQKELQRVLFGLYTLVKVHFAKEEEVYLPLLDEQLDESRARAMFEAMEESAAAAKAAHLH